MNAVQLVFLFIAFISGIAGALLIPTLSLFLTDEIQVNALWVGFFYTANAIVGIVISFLLAKKSDQHYERKKILLLCYILALINCLLFAFNRSYLILVTIGILLNSIASAAMPQLFALAREYNKKISKDIAIFSSLMRAQLSLAWVFGPPIAFILVANYGFTIMFVCAAIIFFIIFSLSWKMLPNIVKDSPINDNQIALGQVILGNKNICLLLLSSTLSWTCSAMYLIDFPIYIVQVLGESEKLTGWLMGLAAAIEIPVMLLAARYVAYTGKKKLMMFAMLSGMVFYLGIIYFPFVNILFYLQVFNALFIGIIASIGMLYFQDLLPNYSGIATTLFTNSVSMGVILAGILQGIISQYYHHSIVYLFSIILLLISLLINAKVTN